MENTVRLADPVSLSDIEEIIDTEYRAIIERLRAMFMSDTTSLLKNRSRIDALRKEIKKAFGIPRSGAYGNGMDTVGIARRFGARLKKLVRESGTTGDKRKDKTLDPYVHALVKKSMEGRVNEMIMRISRTIEAFDNSPKDIHALVIDANSHDCDLLPNTKLDQPALDEGEDMEAEIAWKKALHDPRRMIELLEACEKADAQQTAVAMASDEEILIQMEQRPSTEFAAGVLKTIDQHNPLPEEHTNAEHVDGWKKVFEYFRYKVEEEISRGDTNFDSDQIDIAFEMQLREVGLWQRYCSHNDIPLSDQSEVPRQVIHRTATCGTVKPRRVNRRNSETLIAVPRITGILSESNPDINRVLSFLRKRKLNLNQIALIASQEKSEHRRSRNTSE